MNWQVSSTDCAVICVTITCCPEILDGMQIPGVPGLHGKAIPANVNNSELAHPMAMSYLQIRYLWTKPMTNTNCRQAPRPLAPDTTERIWAPMAGLIQWPGNQ